jgi:hypothetical protein
MNTLIWNAWTWQFKTAMLVSPISNEIWVIKTLKQREGRNTKETPHVHLLLKQ